MTISSTVWIPALFKQLKLLSESFKSSMFVLKIFSISSSPDFASSSDEWIFGRSKNSDKLSIMIFAAFAVISLADTVPLVQTSTVSSS